MEPSSVPESTTDAKATAPLVERYFTREGEDVWETVEWECRDAAPGPGQVLKDVEVPKNWSQQALNIAAKLYLSKAQDSPETSIRALIDRVCHKIAKEGAKAGYFGQGEWSELCGLGNNAYHFYNELVYICLHQIATFNSPVWFNIGRHDRKQCPSACFILDVQDTTASIMQWVKDESDIFRAGSGSGVNPSVLRGSMEPLSTGGVASGPVSFMRISNAAAETIKSGGTTRRAAKIVQLDADHPDIVDFINSKVREEERLAILGEAGVNIDFDMEGERNVAELTSFQSANNSVRVTDEFMRSAECDAPWSLIARKTKEQVGDPISASDLLDQMSEAVYKCADPGIMFHDTINSWHTTPNDAPITCTNPCGELHTPRNSSCNLASLNTLKFVDESGGLDVMMMRHVVDVMTLAMDILVEFCELPTEELTRRTKEYRWLGLGFSNMGAAIMAQGWPYDSDDARDFASSFMSLETGRCYRMSARIAERVGAFDGFEDNRETMLDVMDRHHSFLPPDEPTDLWQAAREDWVDVLVEGHKHGFRNAQATVIAPAGTTSFFMDCDTTGIEPTFNLVTHKTLAGGGSMTLVNKTVRRGLEKIMSEQLADRLIETLEADGVETFLFELDDMTSADHFVNCEVFYGANDISAEGHIRMLAAVQPFISGAASKTINLPESATPQDIRECFELAWRLGVKCIAVYRNNSKVRQVLNSKPKSETTVKEDDPKVHETPSVEEVATKLHDDPPTREMVTHEPTRRRLPRTRDSKTHKIHVRGQLGEHEGYVTVGTYPDGTIGEMFLEGFGRLGGFTQNVLSAWATSVSVSLQYGVPMEVQMRKHVGHCDETGGVVVPAPGEPLVIRSCNSIIDYIARWVISEFGTVDLQEELGVMTNAVKARKMEDLVNSSGTLQGIAPVTSTSWDQTTSTPFDDIKAAQKMIFEKDVSIEIGPTYDIANVNGHAASVEMGANTCPSCKVPMQRTGACWTCSQCFYNTGCG